MMVGTGHSLICRERALRRRLRQHLRALVHCLRFQPAMRAQRLHAATARRLPHGAGHTAHHWRDGAYDTPRHPRVLIKPLRELHPALIRSTQERLRTAEATRDPLIDF